jgi:hypothetical protein
VRRELRYVTEQIDDAAPTGHDPGHPDQPGIQIEIVGFQLRGRQFGVRWRRATGLCVVLGHGEL